MNSPCPSAHDTERMLRVRESLRDYPKLWHLIIAALGMVFTGIVFIATTAWQVSERNHVVVENATRLEKLEINAASRKELADVDAKAHALELNAANKKELSDVVSRLVASEKIIDRIDNEGSRVWVYSRPVNDQAMKDVKSQMNEMQASLRITQDAVLKIVTLTEANARSAKETQQILKDK